ncbi:hypothetical protein BJY24_003635 [Nocardia transvalensis]|uniref:PPE domain-containing protein n=1 Tax=Nocardia transvalensis TaxID=37333 RepID=A0A7W9PFP3_9NOCA|nr:PPE domain-containing protein [Nocardia transvalensis]MBB5914768.1 hypothetical protein [Nocardia transvalensis]
MTGDNPPLDPQQATLATIVGIDPALLQATKTKQGSKYMQDQLGFNSTDDDYIRGLEEWAGVSHHDIHSHAQDMKPGAMHDSAKAWNTISASLGGAVFGLNLSIQKALSDGVHGQFGDAALNSAKKFVQQATDVQEVIQAVGLRIETAAFGAEAVMRTVPPPKAGDGAASTQVPTVLDVLGAGNPAAAVAAGRSEDELWRDAIAAMQANYDTTYGPAGKGVPTFVPVAAPGGDGNGNDHDGGIPNSGGGNGGTDGGTGGTNGKTEGNDGKTDNGEQQAGNDATSTSSAGDSSNSAGNQGNQSTAPGQQGAGTTGTGAGPSATSAAGFGGGAGSGGRGGGSGLSGGGAGGTSGGAGRGASGVPGAGNNATAAASGMGAGKAGASGMGGMPGMGHGAGGRKDEESENEHKTPDYLIMDREEELLGRRDPTVPQAIGADIPAAQYDQNDGRGRRG